MGESRMLFLEIVFRSGRTLNLVATQTELDWLFDKMFGRTDGDFSNFSGAVVSVNDIEFIKYKDVNQCF